LTHLDVSKFNIHDPEQAAAFLGQVRDFIGPTICSNQISEAKG